MAGVMSCKLSSIDLNQGFKFVSAFVELVKLMPGLGPVATRQISAGEEGLNLSNMGFSRLQRVGYFFFLRFTSACSESRLPTHSL